MLRWEGVNLTGISSLWIGSKIFPRWKQETLIPINAKLFRTVHFSLVNPKTKMPTSSAFHDVELSCDWEKYSTPEKSLKILSKQFKKGIEPNIFKNPAHFFVCSVIAETTIQNLGEQLKHDPIQYFPPIKGIPNNRSHVLLVPPPTDKKEKVRKRGLLALTCKWEIFNEERLNVLFTELKK